MVTASRLKAAPRGAEPTAARQTAEDRIHPGQEGPDGQGIQVVEGGYLIDDEDLILDDKEDGPPLSYGEQLVLQTYLHSKRRPVDKQRLDLLANPRKREEEPSDAIPQDLRRMGQKQLQTMIGRLYTPKIRMDTTEDDKIAEQEEKSKQGGRPKDFDLNAMVLRLHAPKIKDDAEADEASAAPSRPPDLDRINALARPKKRGASAECWGLQPLPMPTLEEDRAPPSGPSDGGAGVAVEDTDSPGTARAPPTEQPAAGSAPQSARGARAAAQRSRVDGRWARAGFAESGRPIGGSILASAGYDGLTTRTGLSGAACRPAPWMIEDAGRGLRGAPAPQAKPATPRLDSAWASACKSRVMAPSEVPQIGRAHV